MGSALQCKTVQYTTVQYNTITQIIQNDNTTHKTILNMQNYRKKKSRAHITPY